jgi:hypothetical protein
VRTLCELRLEQIPEAREPGIEKSA